EGERDEDAVDTEGNEGVGADVGEQEFYGDDGDKKRGDEACRQNSELLRREGGGILVEVVQRDGEHGRHRKQEGELHDRAARQAQDKAANRSSLRRATRQGSSRWTGTGR